MGTISSLLEHLAGNEETRNINKEQKTEKATHKKHTNDVEQVFPFEECIWYVNETIKIKTEENGDVNPARFG